MSRSAGDTKAFGQKLAQIVRPGDCFTLSGPLGAGKTTFVQGLARGMHCRETPSSPTFVLAQTYHGRVPLHHLDFYRMKEQEVLSLGLDDFYRDRAVCAIEWSERAPHLLPPGRLEVVFRYQSAGGRKIHAIPRGPSWIERLRKWKCQ